MDWQRSRRQALEILDAWLHTAYEGGRHDISLGLIADAEETLSKSTVWDPADPMLPAIPSISGRSQS